MMLQAHPAAQEVDSILHIMRPRVLLPGEPVKQKIQELYRIRQDAAAAGSLCLRQTSHCSK